jgi:hypothetical protein
MVKRGERILAEKEGVPFRLEPENATKKGGYLGKLRPEKPIKD